MHSIQLHARYISRISTVWKTVLESIVAENDWMSSQITDQGKKQSCFTYNKAVARIFLPGFISI